MKFNPTNKIYIKNSLIKTAGRGVFASQNIKRGEVIERCPIIIIPKKEVPDLNKTNLYSYYFQWGKNRKIYDAGISLGYGSLYNHSYSPNTKYIKSFAKNYIDFLAIKNIYKDEELTINYNSSKSDYLKKLWFDVR